MKTKTILPLLLLFLFLSSCEKNGITPFDTVIEENINNPNKFNQISLTINIRNKNGDYLVLERIDSVKLRVNGKDWGTFSSERIDTTGLSTKVADDIRVSSEKVNYLLIAPYIIDMGTPQTAGEFIDYLNRRLVFTPGDYVSEIAEVKVKNLKGLTLASKPQFYKNFSIADKATSSYVGEISLSLK